MGIKNNPSRYEVYLGLYNLIMLKLLHHLNKYSYNICMDSS